jgi:hypothetical protein
MAFQLSFHQTNNKTSGAKVIKAFFRRRERSGAYTIKLSTAVIDSVAQ